MKKRSRLILAVIALLALGAVLLGVSATKSAKTGTAAKAYDFTAVSTGTIEKSISTSGTLEPVSTVSVLAEMSGRIEKVYADYNEPVRKGQVLVSLNTDMLRLQRLQALADLSKAEANHALQLLDFQNKSKLAEKGLVSDYDLASSKSSLAVYEASLNSAKAALEIIDTKLNQYALIKSPIDGIVLDRAAEPGQSVVEGSSSNATSLFTLAEDLVNMEIKAEVDELDIGSVKAGQAVRFTIDSKPGVDYEGRVKAIHLIPSTTNNVVNYYVIISAANKDGNLLPGMTATIAFVVERKAEVLTVANAALRYTPTSLTSAEIAKRTWLAGQGPLTAEEKQAAEKRYDEALAASTAQAPASGSGSTANKGLAGMLMGGPMGGPPPGAGRAKSATASAGGSGAASAAPVVVRKALWYLDNDGSLQPVLVEVGVTDGIKTQVSPLTFPGQDPGSAAAALEKLKIILKEKAAVSWQS